MTKPLNSLLTFLPTKALQQSESILVKGITDDSRKVKKDFLFIAVKGQTHDGHDFIDEAVKNGASAVIGQKEINIKRATYIKVKDSRRALGKIASNWYGKPSEKLKTIGVTGTDGKTTTAHFIYQLMKAKGLKAGLISTVSAKIEGKEIETGLHVTNPDPIKLQRLLKDMVNAGCEYAILEVTSHGIDQKRIAGIHFDISVLTNVTREHLDYHKTFKKYLKTKVSFLKKGKTVVLNKNDENFKEIKDKLSQNVVTTYSLNSKADVYAKNVLKNKNGLIFKLYFNKIKYSLKTSFREKYNLSNLLAALGVLKVLEIDIKGLKEKIYEFTLPVGRMEKVKTTKGFEIIVDFAHTPNAIKNALQALDRSTGRVIAVFGSAGERDKGKRFLMGEAAGHLADVSIFTAEDPRSENIMDILEDMTKGAKKAGAKKISPKETVFRNHVFVKIPERGEAIVYAVNMAKKKDVIIIAGKGHEKSMAYDSDEHPWSDKKKAMEALNLRKDYSAVLLAAGKGTRMKSETSKLLHKIAGRPMISYSLENLREAQYKNIVIVVGYKKEDVMEETRGDVSFAEQEEALGTGHAAWVGLERLPKKTRDFLVTNGDDSAFYSKETLVGVLQKRRKTKAKIVLGTTVNNRSGKLGMIKRNKKGKITGIVHGTGEKNKKGEINCGLYAFNKKWFEKNIKKVQQNEKGEYYITDLIGFASKEGVLIESYPVPNSEWAGVNTNEELAEAEKRMRDVIKRKNEEA